MDWWLVWGLNPGMHIYLAALINHPVKVLEAMGRTTVVPTWARPCVYLGWRSWPGTGKKYVCQRKGVSKKGVDIIPGVILSTSAQEDMGPGPFLGLIHQLTHNNVELNSSVDPPSKANLADLGELDGDEIMNMRVCASSQCMSPGTLSWGVSAARITKGAQLLPIAMLTPESSTARVCAPAWCMFHWHTPKDYPQTTQVSLYTHSCIYNCFYTCIGSWFNSSRFHWILAGQLVGIAHQHWVPWSYKQAMVNSACWWDDG